MFVAGSSLDLSGYPLSDNLEAEANKSGKEVEPKNRYNEISIMSDELLSYLNPGGNQSSRNFSSYDAALVECVDNKQMPEKMTRRQIAKLPKELSKREASDLLGVHFKTLEYWIKTGKEELNPYPSKFGRGLIFPKREILKILRKREKEANRD
jgi:hypothetical protein